MDERTEAILSEEVPEASSLIVPDWQQDATPLEEVPAMEMRTLEARGYAQATCCPTCGGRASVEFCRMTSVRDGAPEGPTRCWVIRCWQADRLGRPRCSPTLVRVPDGQDAPTFPAPPETAPAKKRRRRAA